ncbi:MAG: helix-turn-helix domain-containing protein [Myxococcota bacterium]
MRELLDQDHYEILEIRRGASDQQIDRAHRVVRSAYEGDSMALYSVYEKGDAAVILERIDEAHRVLSDEVSRAAYDRYLHEKEGIAVASATGDASVESSDRRLAVQDLVDEFDAEEATEFDGSRLRRVRLRAGIELDQIAEITKVSMTNLRNIEDENFEDLPASVYVRGFLVAYAQTIGIDPDRVAQDYMVRVETSRAAQGRSRFLGRR